MGGYYIRQMIHLSARHKGVERELKVKSKLCLQRRIENFNLYRIISQETHGKVTYPTKVLVKQAEHGYLC